MILLQCGVVGARVSQASGLIIPTDKNLTAATETKSRWRERPLSLPSHCNSVARERERERDLTPVMSLLPVMLTSFYQSCLFSFSKCSQTWDNDFLI